MACPYRTACAVPLSMGTEGNLIVCGSGGSEESGASGESYGEGASLSVAGAARSDCAAVVFDNPVGDAKSESCALSLWLAGEEWIEDVLQCFLIHATAVVVDIQHDVIGLLHQSDRDMATWVGGLQGI